MNLYKVDAPDTEDRETAEEVTAPEPPVQLSDGAIKMRMRRIMQPRADGSYLVPEGVIKDWVNEEGKVQLKALFEKAAYNKDRSPNHIYESAFSMGSIATGKLGLRGVE